MLSSPTTRSPWLVECSVLTIDVVETGRTHALADKIEVVLCPACLEPDGPRQLTAGDSTRREPVLWKPVVVCTLDRQQSVLVGDGQTGATDATGPVERLRAALRIDTNSASERSEHAQARVGQRVPVVGSSDVLWLELVEMVIELSRVLDTCGLA